MYTYLFENKCVLFDFVVVLLNSVKLETIMNTTTYKTTLQISLIYEPETFLESYYIPDSETFYFDKHPKFETTDDPEFVIIQEIAQIRYIPSHKI